MFKVYHSNQLDVLKELMALLIERDPLSHPLQKEVVLVQSPGMAQWLQMQLADRFGIAANIEFPLPATFIWHMFTTILPGIPQESAFNKDAMTWKLLCLLPDFLDDPRFAPLRHYLQEDTQGRKSYQLAARVADLFDQYLVYRPQWLNAWEAGELCDGLADDQQWQAPLWQKLVEYTRQLQQPEWHRANLYERFIHALNQASERPPGLPERVFICGIAALPPIYLQALRALGQHIEVHLLFNNPCRYYWGDIQDQAFLAKLQHRRRQRFWQKGEVGLFRDAEQAAQGFNADGEQQIGNPLLASWGKLGRDNLYLLSQLDDVQDIDAFVEPQCDTLLQRLQKDILELADSAVVTVAPQAGQATPHCLVREDESLTLHACHSPLREVEVLHDYLLRCFDEQPDLMPRDVIVMVADINQYAPYIQAVFGQAAHERHLPFALSDRSARDVHPLLPAFIALLTLPESRFQAESVLSLLEVPALAKKFAIDESGLSLLRRWVEESGIRWGLDDDMLSVFDLPPLGQNTWQFGLSRMLLGTAMQSEAGAWQGILPYDESSGLIAGLAGQLAEFLQQLAEWRQRLTSPKPLTEWMPMCQALLDSFFVMESLETEAARGVIERQWLQVIQQGISAGYTQAVSLVVLKEALAVRLQQTRISQRFLAGTLNFCTLMPMRSVPFKVVCLLGMNDGVYPRTLPPLGFDLMANQPQRGDRSRREDDRYLFLEAVLSAQHQLYISYIGRNIQDNSERYPSVLISELLDYLSYSHCLEGDEALDSDVRAQRVRQHLVWQHSRVPFSADNFQPGSRWQSYATEWLAAARGEGQETAEFACALPHRVEKIIQFEDLCRFYRHPVRAFFQQRLGVYFRLENQELQEEEPFTLQGLNRYQFNQSLLTQLIDEEDTEPTFRRFKAAGVLPYGVFADLYWQQQQQEMAALASRVRQYKQTTENLELNLACGLYTVSGWLNHVQKNNGPHSGVLRWRPAMLTILDGIQLWLEHLAFCASGQQGISRMFGRKNSEWAFASLTQETAQQLLDGWLNGYETGLSTPLYLLPRSAWSWLEGCWDSRTRTLSTEEESQQKARQKLQAAWTGNLQIQGEGDDPYLQRLFRQLGEAETERIIVAAQQFLLPLAQHRVKADSSSE